MVVSTSAPNVTATALLVENVSVYYNNILAVRDVNLEIPRHEIVALIGPSGCGKSTVLRCLNRMNDLITGARMTGRILLEGQDINGKGVDPVQLRRYVGIVFQHPNPFRKSVYENVAFGARVNGYRGDMDELVERSLRQVALWDEVKDKLRDSALSLSGGEQQRLCIARAIAVGPQVILMDEPCSALDPVSTAKVEELMHNLKQRYTIVIVTHNMRQASRVSDRTAFFNVASTPNGCKVGYLVEYDHTPNIFCNPQQDSTQDYLSGRFG